MLYGTVTRNAPCRGLLRFMPWAAIAVVWIINGAIPHSAHLGSGLDTHHVNAEQGGPVAGLSTAEHLQDRGLGTLGQDQLDWLEDDPLGRPGSQPIAVFAHIPLWLIFKNWSTDNDKQTLPHLKHCLFVAGADGDSRRIMRKTSGNVTFRTPPPTAFPQPALPAGVNPANQKIIAPGNKTPPGPVFTAKPLSGQRDQPLPCG